MVGCWLDQSLSCNDTNFCASQLKSVLENSKDSKLYTCIIMCMYTALTALPQTMIYFVFVKHAIGQNNVFWFFVSFLWLLYLIYFMIYLCIKLSFH